MIGFIDDTLSVMRWMVLLAAVNLSSLAMATIHEAATYSVGVAAVDITPDYPIRLNGFGGRTKESEGVRQPLWAKAMAVGIGDQDTVIVITVDTLGIPDDLTERLAEKLKAHGLDRSRLAICASHTHSGPMIRNCANTLFGQPIPDVQWQTILKYSDELEVKLEQVAIAALTDRQPARLSWGIGKVSFAMNRRTKGGPVDHDLPLLAVHDLHGSLRAVFTNYACHCVTLSDDAISGDWAGYAMAHVQRRNPGCEALIAIGCGADSNPRGGVLGSNFDAADELGRELADEVQRLLNTKLQPLTQPPIAFLERVALPLVPLPTRDQWLELAKQPNAIGYHARTQLTRLDRGERLMTEVSYSVQSIAFGDELAWVFLPGEVVVDYALRLKRELDGNRLWLNAYSNACPGYVPSERILKEGGYEGGGAMVYYDIPGPYATGLEETITTTVLRQLKDRFAPVVDVGKTDGIAPLSPAKAVSTLRTTPGFHAELMASEPMIESPVAIAFGPDGRLWVAEMSDYPQGNSQGEPGGQIRCLSDDDGDGQYDSSVVFLSGIPFPTGVTVWRDGLLVCAAPDILYAQDTNHDGKADDVRKLFTGFATHNYQARVNSLEYGLDGWVYGSCGLFGGEITCVKTGAVVSLGKRDFRFHPDTGVLEPASGATQQGRVRNDWDDWFGCNNGTPLMHYPLASHYLQRNPYLVPSRLVVAIEAGPEPGRLFSISNQVLFKLSGPPNRATAACGLGVYRDELLGTGYSQNAFTCEPVNNLVHRQVLTANQTTFTSRRDEDESDREFLASTDPWFRPVQVRTGPDGALWVVDMYRYVIEHPIWIPPDRLATLDPRAGSKMGRIYRIVRDDAPSRTTVRFDRLNGESLAAAMESPNGPNRDLVQQLIEWRRDAAAVPELKRLCLNSTRPEVRIQALSTWSNLELPPIDVLRKMLADSDPHVRRHAVRISESQLEQSSALATEVSRLALAPDAFVQLQVAYSAGAMKPTQAAETLAELLAIGETNEHLESAIESSLSSDNIIDVMMHLKTRAPVGPAMDRLLINAATLADADSLRQILSELSKGVLATSDAAPIARLAQFIESWQRRSPPTISPANDDLKTLWQPPLELAVRLATDEESATQLRTAAIRLLALGPFLGVSQTKTLASLLTPQTAPDLQSAALAALKREGSSAVADLILDGWAAREPRLRKESVSLLLSRASWTQSLLTAIAANTVSASELDLPQQQSLLENSDPSIRTAAAKSFQPRSSVARQATIDRYMAAVNDSGDPSKGRHVFQKQCSNCHRVQDVGYIVGPDIHPYGSKPLQAFLVAILDPNQAIDPRYQSYVLVLNDGRSVTGIIAEEAASSLTLLSTEGKRETVLRSEIEQIRSTEKSLMPEGIEQNLSVEDINHLWAYFQTLRMPPKVLDGNSPRVIEVSFEGNVALLASQAEIYGAEITFELPFQNIGYWSGDDDRVRWRLSSKSNREVEVWAEWACDATAAGNRFVIEGATPVLSGVVESTGAWSRYRLVHLGKILIAEGESELAVRPDGELRSALADLRAIHLVAGDLVPQAVGTVDETSPTTRQSESADEIAIRLIDDKYSAEERERWIAENLSQAGAIINALAKGLPEKSGSPEEYRRIPWIWRIAIAVGKDGNADRIRSVLASSLPKDGQRLEHWQAVVIGGGLINGLSLVGKWPSDAISTIIGDDELLNDSWKRCLQLSTAMADEESVPVGTRYDALRMVAMLDWTIAGPQLTKYLQKGIDAELQMGAISAMSDVRNESVASLLIAAYPHCSAHNRELVLSALKRTEERSLALEQSEIELQLAP